MSYCLADELAETGKQAGLDKVGFASAESFISAKENLENRRLRGFSGGMNFTYRNPSRSTSPAAALPSAASIVVGAYSYIKQDAGIKKDTGHVELSEIKQAKSESINQSEPTGRVALYARRDYYAELKSALEKIAEKLMSHGYKALILADDNALMDREAAFRAGIGWYGKNTNLLMPQKGSWFVLGSVLTDAALTPSEPLTQSCGSCRLCLTSCPTGAILEGGIVDARRCLAWLLQKEGVFPAEYRISLVNRIYGCDDCQLVCPINRRAQDDISQSSKSTALEGVNIDKPSQSHGVVALKSSGTSRVFIYEILNASDGDIMRDFGRWYIPKRDPSYIRRNALVILGNIGDSRSSKTKNILECYLKSPNEILRAHAVWSAKRLGHYDLLSLLAGEREMVVLEELRRPVPLNA